MGRYKSCISYDTRQYAKTDDLVSTLNKECKSCGSDNTYQIYQYSVGEHRGYEAIQEFKCRDCGKYTAYDYKYDAV